MTRVLLADVRVLKLIAEGLTSREIGAILHISDKTVERHRSTILEQLGLVDHLAGVS